MRAKTMFAALLLALPLSFAGATTAVACEPGDPNCNIGCEVINRTPVVNKHVSCNT